MEAAETTCRIVMIEDNPGDVMLLRMALADVGVGASITVCRDGEVAINRIESGECAPDIILLDLNVPRRDGIEVLQTIRSTPTWSNVPVMVLTASFAPRDRQRVEELGAAYVHKPQSYSGFLVVAAEVGTRLQSPAPAVATA